jgi:signal-transduction protein with cAMP-binding, CBS, and nucleotidyltransferase domain
VHKLVSEGVDPKTTPVSSLMEESLLSIDMNASLTEASFLMQEYNISHLSVTKNKDIAEILSIKDLVLTDNKLG